MQQVNFVHDDKELSGILLAELPASNDEIDLRVLFDELVGTHSFCFPINGSKTFPLHSETLLVSVAAHPISRKPRDLYRVKPYKLVNRQGC